MSFFIISNRLLLNFLFLLGLEEVFRGLFSHLLAMYVFCGLPSSFSELVFYLMNFFSHKLFLFSFFYAIKVHIT